MMTPQITLPDELAQQAASADLLSPEAMETMLREQLRRTSAQALRSMWERAPAEGLTPEIEQQIVQEVCAVRAEQRLAEQEGDSRLSRRPLAIEKLDVAEKRQVIQLLDAFIERGQLKRKVESRT